MADEDCALSTPDVVIVGAGVYGLAAARRLAGEGLKVAVLERQASLGGIWSSCANASSRVQNHEAAYRLGYAPAEEDYTQRDNVLAEMRKAADAAGVAKRILYNAEVVRVVDSEDTQLVRVFYRRLPEMQGRTGPMVVEEIQAGSVIFCTGTLQRPRCPSLPGEEAFAGQIVDGLGDRAEKLDFAGKTVVVLGMGSFAVESARTALLAGAVHVDIIARHKNIVSTRFARVVNILAHQEFRRGRDAVNEEHKSELPQGLDPASLMLPPYLACGAREAMPNVWLHELNAGRRPFVWSADSATPWTTSDFFFVACALGKLEIHVGQVERLEPGTVHVAQGRHGNKRLAADIVVKNWGFNPPEDGDCMGGACEVVGHRSYIPPMWITPRVLAFRHETDLPAMSAEDWRHGDELFNFVGSAPFGVGVLLEIYLHFVKRPEELKRLMISSEPLRVPLSRTTKLDISRGIHAALEFGGSALRRRINSRRQAVNEETWERYAPAGTPTSDRRNRWVRGFLAQNRADWQETCEQLTGDPHAVPYIWERLLTQMHASGAATGGSQPVPRAAL